MPEVAGPCGKQHTCLEDEEQRHRVKHTTAAQSREVRKRPKALFCQRLRFKAACSRMRLHFWNCVAITKAVFDVNKFWQAHRSTERRPFHVFEVGKQLKSNGARLEWLHTNSRLAINPQLMFVFIHHFHLFKLCPLKCCF